MHRVGDDQKGHGAVEQRQIPHDPEDRLLLGAFDVGRSDKLRAAAELRPRAGRHDLAHRLAASDQRPGEGHESGPGLGRHGFAGKHRLIDQHRSVDQFHVGGDHGAERQLHHVAGDQLGSGKRLPAAVAPR